MGQTSSHGLGTFGPFRDRIKRLEEDLQWLSESAEQALKELPQSGRPPNVNFEEAAIDLALAYECATELLTGERDEYRYHARNTISANEHDEGTVPEQAHLRFLEAGLRAIWPDIKSSQIRTCWRRAAEQLSEARENNDCRCGADLRTDAP